jgi:hypothetical protein
MAQNVQNSVKSLHSFMTGTHLSGKLHDESVIFIANSSGGIVARNKTEDAHFHRGVFNGAIDSMHP